MQTITEEMFLLLPTVPKPIFWGMWMIFVRKRKNGPLKFGQKIVMQREGLLKAVNFLRKLLGNLLKRQKNKGFKPAPDITGLNKEHHRDVVWRPVSPWSKRRWRFKRTNHPWFKKR